MAKLRSRLRDLKSRVFLAHGRRPYARGYISYRQSQLEQCLREIFPSNILPPSWGLWLDERIVEYPWFFSRLPHTAGRLLDAGSILNHEFALSHQKLKNKKVSVFTLAPEAESHWQRGISYVYGDLRDCCFRDEYFDWIANISTLEHVGMDNARHYTSDSVHKECRPESHSRALLELRRVLKTGGTLYITLPYGRSANLGWLQIFDVDKVRRLVEVFCPQSYVETYFRYTDSGWQYSSAIDCADAAYHDSSQNGKEAQPFAAAEAIVCLELVK